MAEIRSKACWSVETPVTPARRLSYAKPDTPVPRVLAGILDHPLCAASFRKARQADKSVIWGAYPLTSSSEATLTRIGPVVPSRRTFVIVNSDHVEIAADQTHTLPRENVLVQPGDVVGLSIENASE